MKRFIYVALILSLFLLLTISCVNATDLPISGNYNITEEEAIEEALRYLNDYTTMTFLYEDTALVDYPARLDEELGEMSISLPADTFACATNTREYLNPDTLTDHTKHTYADLYLALVAAMLLGRVAGGVAKVLFYLSGMSGMTALSMPLLASTYFVQSIPGIVIQLIILPTLVFTLMKARLIPERYPKKK